MIRVVAIAVGILVLVGLGFLFTNRRRRDRYVDIDEPVYEDTNVAPAPAAPAESAPAFFTGTPESGLPPDRPLEAIPEDLDQGELGPHMQAAYRGPTPDNPSLSLKKRLKRARFLDQQEAQPASDNCSAEAMIAHARAAREAHDEEREQRSAFWPHDRKDDETKSPVQS